MPENDSMTINMLMQWIARQATGFRVVEIPPRCRSKMRRPVGQCRALGAAADTRLDAATKLEQLSTLRRAAAQAACCSRDESVAKARLTGQAGPPIFLPALAWQTASPCATR